MPKRRRKRIAVVYTGSRDPIKIAVPVPDPESREFGAGLDELLPGCINSGIAEVRSDARLLRDFALNATVPLTEMGTGDLIGREVYVDKAKSIVDYNKNFWNSRDLLIHFYAAN